MAIRSIFSTLLLYFLAHHNPVEGANVASHLTSDEVWEFRLPSPDQPDPPDELEIAAVTYGQGTFLVAGNYLGTSTDGKEWSFSSSPDFIQSAIWAGDRFLLAGRNGLFVSNEGVNAELVHQNHDFLFGLAYGKERSVVVGLEGKTLFSDDFILWTEGENEVSTNLFGAAYGGGRFVAVGANGTVIYSDDGQRWQAGDSGSTSDLFDVAYGDGRFIAVGQEVLWSKDGRNWLPEPAVTAETAHWGPFFRIEYACNVFVTTAWLNRILAREDGGKWYELLTGMSEGYKTLGSRNGVSIGYPWSMDIGYGHGTFIHAGRSTIQQTVEIGTSPRLTTDSAYAETERLDTENELGLVFHLRNTGGEPGEGFVEAKLSRTGEWDDEQNILLDYWLEPSVEPGESRSIRRTILIDANVPAGVYYLLVGTRKEPNSGLLDLWISDSPSIWIQSDTPGLPDLVISAVEAPASAVTGDALQIEFTIENLGENGDAHEEGILIEAWIGRTPLPMDADDQPIGVKHIGPFENGLPVTATIGARIPHSTAPADYYLKMFINRDGAIDERDFKNNAFVSDKSVLRVRRSIQRASLTAARLSTLVIQNDGTLWGWGQNDFGKIGDGTSETRRWPVRIGNDDDWVAVSLGWNHTLALKEDGTLWAWGDNSYGQLGIQGFESTLVPVRVGEDDDWVQVSAGHAHTLALRSDGSLWGWGYARDGRLGPEYKEDIDTPVRVGGDNDWSIIQVDPTGTIADTFTYYSVHGVKTDGTYWVWRSRPPEMIGFERSDLKPPIESIDVYYNGYVLIDRYGVSWTSHRPSPFDVRWQAVSLNILHRMLLATDGSLWAVGQNDSGQLGIGSTEPIEGIVPVEQGRVWKDVATGFNFTVAMKIDGSVWSWGSNFDGILGHGDTVDRAKPVRLEFEENPAETSFSEWRAKVFESGDNENDFVSGPSAAPAGIPNLISFLLGEDPWAPNFAQLPQVSYVETSEGERMVQFSYRRIRNRTEIVDTVEVSTNLKDWEPVSSDQIEIVGISARAEKVYVHVPLSERDRTFLRLSVIEASDP